MQAAVRLGDLFAILHAFSRSSVRHHDNVRAGHVELIFVCGIRSSRYVSASSLIGSNQLLFVLCFTFGTDGQRAVADNFVQLGGIASGLAPFLVERNQSFWK